MNATQKTYELMERLSKRGINLSFWDANVLRRAQMTLHRWNELECGDGNDYASWSIERDEETNVPYRCVYPHNDTKARKYKIADREKGALKRISEICKESNLHFYYQSDPRGCSLYVSNEKITDNDYTRGVGCY
jgi:hypothetical protein